MSFGITNFERLPWYMQVALEDMEAQFQAWLRHGHNADGSHGATNGVNPFEADGHWWRKGPWIFDDPLAADPHVAGLRPQKPPAGTYHNYAPLGIDSAVILEIEGTGDIVLTGIKARAGQHKRLLMLRNRDSGFTITLKHENTGSLVTNWFDLPGDEDVVLAPNQNIWLYYDPARQAWTAFITPHQSGGLEPGTGNFLQASLVLTQAQFIALNTTPQIIIPAPGANKIAVPLWLAAEQTTTVAWATSPAFTLRYVGNPTELVTGFFLGTNSVRTFRFHDFAVGPLAFNSIAGDLPTNIAVEVRASADIGGAGTTSNIRFIVGYQIIDAYV